MPLFGADEMTGILRAYRLCWITGRFSGGKTSLAYRIAQPFLDEGYRLITNNRCVWADELDSVKLNERRQLHAVVILDEGGLEFKQSRQIEEVASYAAKMDLVYIIPSWSEPARKAQIITIQPIFTLRSIGLPIVVYTWHTRMGDKKDKGWFWWLDPWEVFGVYSRTDPGDDCIDIVNWAIKGTEDFKKAHGRYRVPALETEGGQGVGFDAFVEAAEGFAGAVDDLAAIPQRRRR